MLRKKEKFKFFVRQLLEWNVYCNDREMPWKHEKDPYKIWVSEIILQQTRVNQGLKYYHNFLKNFPGIQELAHATEAQVYKVWQGLGYYSRCRHMMTAAGQMVNDFGGKFPSQYADIRKLKGVGDYTAAAIASFAFGLPHAVVDGNVMRVLARYFHIYTPVDAPEGKKQFLQLANLLLEKGDPAAYNQAIMDFGATVCKPRNPNCGECPLQKNCSAYVAHRVDMLPVKEKKMKIRHRYFNYLVLRRGKSIYFQKRNGKDIWQNLFEPYLIEDNHLLSREQLQQHQDFYALNLNGKLRITDISQKYSQKLTHQHIHAQFTVIETVVRIRQHELKALGTKEIESQYPLPKIIHRYLKDKNYL